MSIKRKLKERKIRRRKRVRDAITRTRPRVSVARSAKHIYAQVIDDTQGKTLVSFSSAQLAKPVGDKKSIAKKVGLALAEKALGKGVKDIVFERGSCRYHGRVKSLAEGLREGGLNF